MIGSRRRGFCPKPLRAPDPDHHNKSVIVCTKSPDVKASQSYQYIPKNEDFNLLTHEIANLRHQNNALRMQIVAIKQRMLESEVEKLRSVSQEKEEELRKSRTRMNQAKDSNLSTKKQMDEIRIVNGEASKELQRKDAQIISLEDIIRRTRADEQNNRSMAKRLRDLELENRKLLQITQQNSDDTIEEQNRLLMKKIDCLLGQNESLKEAIDQYTSGETSRIRQLKQKEKELKLELAKVTKESYTQQKEFRQESFMNPQTVDRLKQYFEKELQLCRNRLDEIREQLVQAESRLDLSEKSILQLKAKLKSRQAMSSTNPERIRMDYSPIAQGDSGVVDRIDEDEPQVTKFDILSIERNRIQHNNHVDRLDQQGNHAEEIANMLQTIKERDIEIGNLYNSKIVLEERSCILKSQLEELQRQLSAKLQELQELRRNIPASREHEIERLKKELKELKFIIESGRSSSSEVEGLKKYITGLNEAMDTEHRKNMKLELQNEQLRTVATANFSSVINSNNEQVNRLKLDNRELRLRIEELFHENQLQKLSATKSAPPTQADKASFLNAEISSLRETITHLRSGNLQLQEQLRRSESGKVEMSYKLNQLFTENQMISATVSQLKEQQLLLQIEIQSKDNQLELTRSRLQQSTRLSNEQSIRMQERHTIIVSQNAVLKQQLSQFERLRKDYQLLRSSGQRKTSQLEQVMNDLAQTRQLLTSLSLDDIESRAKDLKLETDKNKNKERVIKISIQKEGLRREVERLKQRVVDLSDEVSRLAHQRQVLQAETNRVNRDREIQTRKTKELSIIIQKYIETKRDDTILQSTNTRPLEEEIARQLRQLEQPTDLSGLKVSLKRMEQSVERIRNHLQSLSDQGSIS